MIHAASSGFGGATFSDDMRHRFELWRHLELRMDRSRNVLSCEASPRALFIMLNPSIADHLTDDPTVRRCIGFAREWGCSLLDVRNLFSLRSTDPSALYADPKAEGDPENIERIKASAIAADIVVCAWGVHGALRGRGEFVHAVLRGSGVKAHHLGLTKGGFPRHPLYLPKDVQPVEWT